LSKKKMARVTMALRQLTVVVVLVVALVVIDCATAFLVRAQSTRKTIMLHSTLRYGPADPRAEYSFTFIIGKKQDILVPPELVGVLVDSAIFNAMVDSIDGSSGSTTTFTSPSHRLCVCVLPDRVSRNNHPMSIHTITKLIESACPKQGNIRVLFTGLDASTLTAPLASAVAKAFPIYSAKTTTTTSDDPLSLVPLDVHVAFYNEDGNPIGTDFESISAAAAVSDGVRLAANLMDTPPEELTTETFADQCKRIAGNQVRIEEIVGEQLRDQGYGGLWGVGKAAVVPPRLVILSYDPPTFGSEVETVALVGKGIVYDTGGLSLKTKEGMPGMKHDMGGAAGMLGAFYAAIRLGVKKRLRLVLCLAENSIGPRAVRNDDILTLYSGKTVEINNSDAEGRLVLGDGVAHATKHFRGLNLVVDLATLTGAQMVCTGKKHAGILANTEGLERLAIEAGLRSGDLCFPMLYAPELLKDEFKSKVADMKNSVKDRNNAQSSCAGHFIESHLSEDYEGGWLHVDMAGPGTNEERGTGYGVGLVLSLLDVPGF
jgi:probable aminopeptidase NPEPL1